MKSGRNNLNNYKDHKGHWEYTVPKGRSPPVKLAVPALK